jgi:signal transduction histidine kinase
MPLPQFVLTPLVAVSSVETDIMCVPMNLPLPRLSRACGNFFQRGAFCLLCLALNLVSARADDDSAALASNFPSIYVAKSQPEVTNGLGCWMWDKVTLNKQTVRFWHRFDVPKTNRVVYAELRIAADNAFKVWLDGQELGSGSDWRTLSIYHLQGRLNGGAHVLAVEGFNDNDQAGIILGLRLELADGQVLQIRSDPSWCVVPTPQSGWETAPRPGPDWLNATFAANFGRVPWWSVPTSVLHIREALPKAIPVWQSREFQIGLFAGCGLFIVLCLYLLIQLVSQSKAHRLVQAERDRIARDIHDDLGSKLTQLLLTGELAQIQSGPVPSAPLSQMCDSARNILATIDDVVWILNSQHDNSEDFAIYVCKYAQHFLQSSPIRCRLDVPQELPTTVLSQSTRRNLFLAIKEALNNAAKHSQATELTVHIELLSSRLTVVVADNGRGFDSAQASQERNGLTNMKLRLAEIGGDCQVLSRPGEGCQVRFQVPLKQPSLFTPLFQSGNPQNSTERIPSRDEAASLPAKTVGGSSC